MADTEALGGAVARPPGGAGGGGGGTGTVPGGTDTGGGAAAASVFGGGGSSSTLPSCTLVFFPSSNSASDLKRLVLPCRRLARSPLNPDPSVPLGPVSCGPRPLARNLVARRFSIPGLQVTMVVVSPRVKVATAGWEEVVGGVCGAFVVLTGAAFCWAVVAGFGVGEEVLIPTVLVSEGLGVGKEDLTVGC